MKVIGIRYDFGTAGKEIADDVKPAVVLMADSSLLKDGKPFFVPDFAESFAARSCIVVRVSRLGKNIAKRFAGRYYDALTVGLSVEARTMNDDFGGDSPEALAYAFDGSAILGDFVPIEEISASERLCATLCGREILDCPTADALSCIDSLIEFISRYFTLKIGDLLYAFRVGDEISVVAESTIDATLNGVKTLHFKIK